MHILQFGGFFYDEFEVFLTISSDFFFGAKFTLLDIIMVTLAHFLSPFAWKTFSGPLL